MKEKIDKVIATVLIVILTVMVLSVVWQVVSRYLLVNPSAYTDELARYLMIWLGVLGAAYVSGKNMHLAIDLLPNKLKGASKARLLIFIDLMIILFAVSVMLIGGLRLVYLTYILDQTSASLQIPLWFIYSILPISGLLVAFYKIHNILYLHKAPNYTETDSETPKTD